MATSNAPIIVLLDSCSYFRLGASFRPILRKLEGDPEYALKVLAELDREYRKSSRHKTKFWWAGQKEHADERAANCFTLFRGEVSWFSIYYIFRTSSHPKYGIIQGVFGGRFLRSARVGRASESLNLHQLNGYARSEPPSGSGND